MSGISSWAGAVSICAVVACIVEMLSSDTKLEKTVRFVLGAFMLCAVVIPLGQAVKNTIGIDFGSEYSYENQIDYQSQKIKILENQIEKLIENTISKKGIQAKDISIDMNIDDENCITMIKARITLNKSDSEKSLSLSEDIRSELGIDCTVETAGI